MKLVHYSIPEQGRAWGLMDTDRIRPLRTGDGAGESFLAALLQWPEPAQALRDAYESASEASSVPLDTLLGRAPDPSAPHLLAPIDLQEVWAAGVTYLRSKVARMEESEGAARFYDMVYDADRPELFFKATPSRVSGPNAAVRIREDRSEEHTSELQSRQYL